MVNLTRKKQNGSSITHTNDKEVLGWNINPLTRNGRSMLLFGLVVLPLVSGVTVLIHSSVILSQSVRAYRDSGDIMTHAEDAICRLDLLTTLLDYNVAYAVEQSNFSGIFGPVKNFFERVSEKAKVVKWQGKF